MEQTEWRVFRVVGPSLGNGTTRCETQIQWEFFGRWVGVHWPPVKSFVGMLGQVRGRVAPASSPAKRLIPLLAHRRRSFEFRLRTLTEKFRLREPLVVVLHLSRLWRFYQASQGERANEIRN